MALGRQAIFALFLIVLSAAYFIETLRLPTPFARGEPGPAFLPMVLAAVLFASAASILLGELRGASPRGENEERLSWKPFLLAALTAAFVAVFELAGFLLATFLYTAAVAALFELEKTRHPLRILAVGLAVGAGVTLVGRLFFVELFDLFLPEGAW